jgi:hypothetical protein
MSGRRSTADRIAHTARARRVEFFGWWYFADGAKEAAPA